MSKPDLDSWPQLSPYLDLALEMDDAERTAWLASIREQNPGLARGLETLLDDYRVLQEERFLERPSVTSTVHPTMAGQTIGAYTLIEPIGQGGMGSVWLADRSDGRFERRAAVKFLSIALAGSGAEERFKREGTILGRLAHPHIAQLQDARFVAAASPISFSHMSAANTSTVTAMAPRSTSNHVSGSSLTCSPPSLTRMR